MSKVNALAGLLLFAATAGCDKEELPDPNSEEVLTIDEVYQDSLGPGDRQMNADNSYFDAYEVRLLPGWRLEAVMTSTELDGTLILARSKRGRALAQATECRAKELSTPRAEDPCLEFTAESPGIFTLMANGNDGKETGSYRLELRTHPPD